MTETHARPRSAGKAVGVTLIAVGLVAVVGALVVAFNTNVNDYYDAIRCSGYIDTCTAARADAISQAATHRMAAYVVAGLGAACVIVGAIVTGRRK